MRFPVAYYLLLLYLTVMLKPLMPLISDAWDHAFSESIHIATVHAKYGANHLQSVLADNASDNNSNGKNQNTVKSAEVMPVHIHQETVTCRFMALTGCIHYNSLQLRRPAKTIILKNYPPPKFSC
jgi:hypothetical protein